MVRRLPHVVALAAIALLMLPTAASAAYTLHVENPENGAVSRALDVEVRVERETLDAPVRELWVRLAGGEFVQATCVRDCESPGSSPVFSFRLDPRAGAPFGDAPLPNGPTDIEAARAEERPLGTFQLNLRVPGSAVGGLAATTEDRAVRLAWKRAPEPDIERYRVERCSGVCDEEGRWEALRETQASASSYSDEPGAGEFSYRVVTIRSTGGDGTLETVSAPVVAEVVPVATGNGEGDGGDGGRDGDGGDADGDGDADGEGTQRSEPPRIGGRDRARSGDAPSMSVERDQPSPSPGVPEVADAYEPELDYSGMESRLRDGGDGGPSTDRTEIDDEVIIGAPGEGEGTFLGALTDPDRVAVPVAGGLLLTAIALHLWRWQKLPIP